MTHKQRVLALLSDGKPHSHHELYGLGCVAHSRVSDLRRDGHRIEQWHEDGVYLYRLVLVEAGSSNPRGTTPTSRCIEPAVEARDGGPASTSTTTDGNQTGAPGETAHPLSAVSPAQLSLVPEPVRGAYDEEAA